MIVWQAKLNEEETKHLTNEELEEMRMRLEDLWEQLKDEFLYA